MSFCRACGVRMKDTDRFCGKCGAAVTSTYSSRTPPPPHGFQYTVGEADETTTFDPVDIEINSVIAGFSYLLFFLPFIFCPQSRYARFHANQGLLLFIFAAIVSVLGRVLSFVFSLFDGRTIVGTLWQGVWFIPNVIVSTFLGLLVLALVIFGMVNGFTGKARHLPLIGRFRLI